MRRRSAGTGFSDRAGGAVSAARLFAGVGVTGGGSAVAALSGAPWWAVTLGVIASSGQVLAAVALGIVQSIAPQDSGDRRRVWELLLGDRRPRGSSDDPSPQAPGK